MNPNQSLCQAGVACLVLLGAAPAAATDTIAVTIDAPYRVPDAYVSTSFGPTPGAAVVAWWEKYKLYWGVQPHGDLACSYQIEIGSEGVLGRYGRVRLTGDCTGSDPIEATISCPAGYARVADVCEANGEPIEEKDTPAPCSSTAHPVNYTTGNKFLSETDLADWNGQGLGFRRSWNSFDGRWHFSYRQRLGEVQTSVYTVSIYEDNGRVVRFNEVGGQWRPDVEVRASLVHDGEYWLYTRSSGERQWFDHSGRLLRIAHPGGELVSLDYSGVDQVTIRDAYGNALALSLDAEHRVVAVTDPDDQIYRYAYDADGRLVAVSYPDATPAASGTNPFGEDNPVREYHYEDARHPLLVTGVTDENGDRHKTVDYDIAGRAVASGLADGSIDGSTLDYAHLQDALDPRVTVTNALGKGTVYHLQAYQGINRVTRIEGLASANCLADTRERSYYPDTGWLQRSWDRAGNATYHVYYTDPERYGLSRTRVEAEGTLQERRYTFDWEPGSRRLVRATLEGQWQADYRYDARGRLLGRALTDLTTFTEPYASQGQRREWSYQYSFFDTDETRVSLLLVDGPRGDAADVTRYEYSPRGFLLSVTNPAGHSTQYLEHNGRGQPGRMVDPNGVETRYRWSHRGWLLSTEVENGAADAVTRYTYDAAGNLTGVAMPDGRKLEYYHDAARHLLQVVDGGGNRITYTRDAAGNVTLETAEDGTGVVLRSIQYVQDELGRLRLLASPAYGERSVGYEYDANDNTSQVRAGGNPPLNAVYDSLNRRLELTHPDGYRSRYQHDAADQPVLVEDQRGLVTRYQYDGLGNLMRQVSPDSGTTDYRYDAAGNRLSALDAEGRLTSYAYDALNRLTGVGFNDTRLAIHFDYDDPGLGDYQLGRLSRVRDISGSQAWVYNALGQPVGIASVVGNRAYTWLFDYDPGGNLLSMSYPGGRRVDYNLDSLGQVVSVVTSAGPGAPVETLMSDANYLPFGPVQSFTYGNGLRREVGFDRAYAPATLQVSGEREVMDWGYEISAEDTVSGISDRLSPAGSQWFRYDAQKRLLGADAEVYGNLNFAYDGVGNRLFESVDSDGDRVPERESQYHYPSDSNRLSGVTSPDGVDFSLAHDATGNLTADSRSDRALTYNTANRLAAANIRGVAADYAYNGLGQRVIKTVSGGETTHFHYGSRGELLLESRPDGSSVREYIYLNGRPLAMVIEDDPVDPGNPQQLVSYSLGVEDGWLRESRQGSGTGGKLNTGSGRGIRVGDQKKELQYKSLLSFHLEAQPRGANLTGAYLVLHRKDSFVVGTPEALGAVTLDLSIGGFSGNPSLQLSDFDAPADFENTGQLQDGPIARADFGGAVLAALESALVAGGSVVQIRLQAATATDGNRKDDYLYYFSGDQGDENRRPRLVLEYQLAE
jgi:YD repeat-containing protein